MGATLTLSWLVRAQVGAKRGNLTLLGGLRGTKLELKGALEAAKKAPRWFRCATTRFDVASGTLIFEPRGVVINAQYYRLLSAAIDSARITTTCAWPKSRMCLISMVLSV